MNEQERSELERLKQRQARLEQELALFAAEINTLERRLSRPEQAAGQEKAAVGSQRSEAAHKEGPLRIPLPAAAPVSIPPAPVPPVIATAASTAAKVETAGEKTGTGETDRPTLPEAPRLRLRAEPTQENLVKGVCQACGRHLEFPISAAGDTIPPAECISRSEPRKPRAHNSRSSRVR